MRTDLIIVGEYCQRCHIDPSFVILLEESGLIELRSIEDQKYILISQLQELERYSRMYYDLSINIEGIDAIRHLLDRIRRMQAEIDILKNKLKIYPFDYFEAPE